LELTTKIDFAGLNVTIPYKSAVIPYLDDLDSISAKIGAVNTIRFENGRKIGYNTDAYGFETSLSGLVGDVQRITGALVLGTGGAAKAVMFVLQKHNIPFLTVSRNHGDILYQDLNNEHIVNYPCIINTTPVGMYPSIHECPELPYNAINQNNFLFDLIYNPEKTLFLTEGKTRGAKIANGFEMLKHQANKAYEIWTKI
jgi:shikimate dehydrogenase